MPEKRQRIIETDEWETKHIFRCYTGMSGKRMLFPHNYGKSDVREQLFDCTMIRPGHFFIDGMSVARVAHKRKTGGPGVERLKTFLQGKLLKTFRTLYRKVPLETEKAVEKERPVVGYNIQTAGRSLFQPAYIFHFRMNLCGAVQQLFT